METKERALLDYNAVLYSALILFTTIALAVQPCMAASIKLRYATYQPPRGIAYQGPDWLMNEISKRTNGKVEFQQYVGGSLLKARELLKGVQEGTADMGFIFVPYFPRELQVLTLPTPFISGPPEPIKEAALMWEFFKEVPEASKTLEKWGQKLIAIHVYGQLAVGATVPVKRLSDVKGLKMRCAAGYDAQHMKCLGASVVFLTMPEVYSAMEKGAVNSVYTAGISLYREKLYETANPFYVLLIPKFSGVMALLTINSKTWGNLPNDVQQVFTEVGKEYSDFESKRIDELEKDYFGKLKEQGCKVFSVTKDEIKKWAQDCEQEAKARWVKEADEQGLPGKELMDHMSELVLKFSD
jgi:TRAP-type C4-dicarboxylate transport system substrate-binding protein